MSIKFWPEEDRPREKLLKNGAKNLSDSELLAILLVNGNKGKSAVDLGRELITHFKSLRSVISCEFNDMKSFLGIGQTKYIRLAVVKEIAERCSLENVYEGNIYYDEDQLKNYLISRASKLKKEVIGAIFLNIKNKILAIEDIFEGTFDRSFIYPFELMKRIFVHQASSIILFHNHPSGDSNPSREDIEITIKLKKNFAPFSIQLLDHLIIGENKIYSILGNNSNISKKLKN